MHRFIHQSLNFIILFLWTLSVTEAAAAFVPQSSRSYVTPALTDRSADAKTYHPNPTTKRLDGVSVSVPFVPFYRSLRPALFMISDPTNGNPVKIIIAGAPASGKGTQCEVIKKEFGVVHLSTGDMLRAAVAAQTEVGKLAKDYMDNGKLVPDDVIIGIVKDRLAQEDCTRNGWLLDGFPRTSEQARALSEAGIEADCFVFLNVPDDILVERVVGRRMDPVTGAIYHLKFSPPPAVDDVWARLVHRSDDTEEKARVRLEQFHANIDAVKDSFADILVTIDGNQAPSSVSQAILRAIQSKVVA